LPQLRRRAGTPSAAPDGVGLGSEASIAVAFRALYGYGDRCRAVARCNGSDTIPTVTDAAVIPCRSLVVRRADFRRARRDGLPRALYDDPTPEFAQRYETGSGPPAFSNADAAEAERRIRLR